MFFWKNRMKYSDKPINEQIMIMSYKLYKKFKKCGHIDCGYFKIAVWIPFIINTEWLMYKITGEDFHWSEVNWNPFK